MYICKTIKVKDLAMVFILNRNVEQRYLLTSANGCEGNRECPIVDNKIVHNSNDFDNEFSIFNRTLNSLGISIIDLSSLFNMFDTAKAAIFKRLRRPINPLASRGVTIVGERPTDPCSRNNDDNTLNGIFEPGNSIDVNKVDWGFPYQGFHVGIDYQGKDGTTVTEWGEKAYSGVVLDDLNNESNTDDPGCGFPEPSREISFVGGNTGSFSKEESSPDPDHWISYDESISRYTEDRDLEIELGRYCKKLDRGGLSDTLNAWNDLEKYPDGQLSVPKTVKSSFKINRFAMRNEEADIFKAAQRGSTGKNSFELFVGAKNSRFMRQHSVHKSVQPYFQSKRSEMQIKEALTFKAAQNTSKISGSSTGQSSLTLFRNRIF